MATTIEGLGRIMFVPTGHNPGTMQNQMQNEIQNGRVFVGSLLGLRFGVQRDHGTE